VVLVLWLLVGVALRGDGDFEPGDTLYLFGFSRGA
jgi:hypothetical protein